MRPAHVSDGSAHARRTRPTDRAGYMGLPAFVTTSPHIECRFGLSCARPDCRYAHPNPLGPGTPLWLPSCCCRVFVCVYTQVCVCVCVCLHACMHACMYAYVCVCMRMYIRIRHVPVFECVYVFMFTHTYTHTHIHTTHATTYLLQPTRTSSEGSW